MGSIEYYIASDATPNRLESIYQKIIARGYASTQELWEDIKRTFENDASHQFPHVARSCINSRNMWFLYEEQLYHAVMGPGEVFVWDSSGTMLDGAHNRLIVQAAAEVLFLQKHYLLVSTEPGFLVIEHCSSLGAAKQLMRQEVRKTLESLGKLSLYSNVEQAISEGERFRVDGIFVDPLFAVLGTDETQHRSLSIVSTDF